MTLTIESIRTRTIELPLTRLQRALLAADIPILDIDDVREYQAEKLKAVKAERSRKRWRNRAVYWTVQLAFMSLYQFLPMAVARQGFGRVTTTLEILAAILSVMIAQISVGLYIGRRLPMSSRLLAWRRYVIGYCAEGVGAIAAAFQAPGVRERTVLPAAAVDICQRVHATGAPARFSVDQLDDDPFLFIGDGLEEYPVFAWDEQGFVPAGSR